MAGFQASTSLSLTVTVSVVELQLNKLQNNPINWFSL